MPVFFVMNHVLYGVGFLRGLLTRRFAAQERAFSCDIRKAD
jgi:hypothetical protein